MRFSSSAAAAADLQARLSCRVESGFNFVGGDVVEVAPPFDPSGGTALVGATLMFEMLCLFAEVIAKRSATQIPVS